MATFSTKTLHFPGAVPKKDSSGICFPKTLKSSILLVLLVPAQEMATICYVAKGILLLKGPDLENVIENLNSASSTDYLANANTNTCKFEYEYDLQYYLP